MADYLKHEFEDKKVSLNPNLHPVIPSTFKDDVVIDSENITSENEETPE